MTKTSIWLEYLEWRPKPPHRKRSGETVGFVSVSANQNEEVGEIGLNAVDPDHAGQGLGSQLYAFAIDHMRTVGMKVATVGTGGDASHAPARRAYQKAGFTAVLSNQWLYKTL